MPAKSKRPSVSPARAKTVRPGAAPLKQAVVQTHGIHQQVVAVADELSTTNKKVRRLISRGAQQLPAGEALARSEKVETNVKQVAKDLQRVNGVLSKGVEHLGVVGKALSESQAAQRKVEAELAAAEQETEAARDRGLHDATTGLPNRALFEDRLVHAISMADRHAWTLAVLFLDLDRFKAVNDQHGHAAGDRVLREVARRLARHTREEDTVCRYGGDEFLFLLVNPQGATNVERIVEAIAASLAEPIAVNKFKLTIGASIGVAHYPDDGVTGPHLVEFADAAMYRLKRSSRR